MPSGPQNVRIIKKKKSVEIHVVLRAMGHLHLKGQAVKPAVLNRAVIVDEKSFDV